MPLINIQPKDMQNGDRVTTYSNTVGTTQETFTFLTSQETVILRNKGSKSITYTIGAQSGTLGRSETVKVSGAITSFNLTSEQGTQAFEIWADETGSTAVGGSDSRVDTLVLKVAELESQSGSGGGGSIPTYSTLAELQADFPTGANYPAWISSESAWYYWEGVVTPPADTTAPTLTITAGGTFTGTKSVTMSTNETATIYYTLDDSDPKSSGTKLTYSTPLILTETDTIKAYAQDTAGNNSAVQTVTYTHEAVDTTAPVLTITPAQTFATTLNVVMSTNETATIYYTLDDSDPISSGTKLEYTAPITLTETDTIKAYAVDSASNASAVQTVTYTFDPEAPVELVTDGLVFQLSDPELTLFNGATLVDGVATFDGSNDYGFIPDNADFTFGSGDFTIQMKAKPSKLNLTQFWFSQNASTGTDYANTSVSLMLQTSNTFMARACVGTTRHEKTHTQVLDMSKYYDVVMRRSGDSLEVFVDGVSSGALALPAGAVINDSPANFALGRWGEAGIYAGVSFKSFLVYKGKALTTNEMTQNANYFA